jgi:hypothetical protein
MQQPAGSRAVGRRSDCWNYLAQASEIGDRIGYDTNHYGLIFAEQRQDS